MVEYDQFTVKFARLILRVREIRGQILDEVIFIEFVIDLIILKYFCESSSKIELFQATLLNQEYISLDSKIKTFKNLNLGKKYQKHVVNLFSDLRKAKEIRNYFAHRMLDNSEEAVNNSQLRLIYYEKGKRKYDSISEDYLKEKLNWLRDLRTKLVVLLMNADFARSSEIDIKV